ncbi:unnamed protein product [Calicophoron daubneyi]|uniref:Uncharacterized protein n=1 Tax=Calicophoron daubneyi TaxID=300641 RepID=A0AAV2TZ84_CALDB
MKFDMSDIRNKMRNWPAFARGSLNLVCDKKQKLLRSITDHPHRVHSKDKVDDACKRIFSYLEYEQRMLTKYFTYMKNNAKSIRLLIRVHGFSF